MTHFGVLVLTNGEKSVEELLAPYDENYDEENGGWFADGSRWDWWQVGGRWTGYLSGYNPEEDPANRETCQFCEGTGKVTPAVGDRYPAWKSQVGQLCKQCEGTGISTKWPTQWADHPGDQNIPVEAVNLAKLEYLPSAIVTTDGKWHEDGRVGWWGARIPDEEGNERKDKETWLQIATHLLDQNPGCLVTVVDCHV